MAVRLITQAALGNYGLEYLLETGVVSPVSATNTAWMNTIFPDSTRVHAQRSLHHYITSMPVALFGDMDVMEQQAVLRYSVGAYDALTNTMEQVPVRYSVRVFGSPNESVKRYQDLARPLSPDMQTTPAYMQTVIDWARKQGVQHVYCITECRPNAVSSAYVLNTVYYTVTGA